MNAQHLRMGSAALLMLLLPGVAGAFEANPPGPKVNLEDPRPWDLSLRVFGGYSDNVQLVPDRPPFFVGDTESFYGGAQLNGGYRLINDEDWAAGAAVLIEGVWYTDTQSPAAVAAGSSDANDYDMVALTPSVYVRRKFDLAGRPASAGLAYTYRWDDAKIPAVEGQFHTVTADLLVAVLPELELGLAYARGRDEFGVEFPATPALDERDADRDSVRVGGTYYFDQRRRNVQLAYLFMNNEAEGRNWDYEAHGLTARIESQLTGPLWGAFEFGYRRGDYRGFISPVVPPPGRQEQEIFNYLVQLIWVIDRHWSLDVYYTFEDIESNLPEFETQTHNVGLGMTYRF